MKLSSLLDARLIRCGLEARSKEEVFAELVDLLVKVHPVRDRDALLRAVLEREALGTTAFGRGAAFPHARSDQVDDLYIVIGTAPKGIEGWRENGEPVRFVALLILPPTSSNTYLQAIAGLANLVRSERDLEAVLAATAPEEVVRAIDRSGIRVRREVTVADVMTRQPISIRPTCRLKEAVDLLARHRLAALPVVDEEGVLLGELSALDVMREGLPEEVTMMKTLAFLHSYEPFERLLEREGDLQVAQCMRRNVLTLDHRASIIEAAARMVKHRSERLYVLEGRRLVGVVVARDFIHAVIRP